MSNIINEEFLKRNLFERAKIGCGYFPWTYYDKRYSVIIAQQTDGGQIYISVSNEETKSSITFEKKKDCGNKFTQDELHNCIKFIGAPDEFEYDE